MTLTIDEIAEILSDIRLGNEQNNEEFSKALTSINHKLEMIADDNEVSDVIKLYISELKKSVDDKHSSTFVKLDNIEKDFLEFAKSQEYINKNSDELISKLENFESSVSVVRDELRQVAEADIENVTRLRDGIALVSDKVFAVEENLTANSKNNFEALKYDFETLKSDLDDLSAKIEEDFSKQREILLDCSSDKEKIAILKSLQDDFNAVNSLISANTEAVKASFQEQSNEIKNSVFDVGENISNAICEKISKMSETLSDIMTEDEFRNFRIDFGDFIQKILDNANALHLDFDANKEQILFVLEKLNSLNYSEDFENISFRLDEIKDCFENNSKMNYENISDKINSLKDKMLECFDGNSDKSEFEKINVLLSDLSSNLKYLRDLASVKPNEMLENISSALTSSINEMEEKFNSDMVLNLSDMKLNISNVISEIDSIKNDFLDNNKDNLTNITQGFDGIQMSLENIISAFNSLSDDFKGFTSENSNQIISVFNDVSNKVEDLKSEIADATADYLNKVCNTVHEVSDKIDVVMENDNLNNSVLDVKNEVISLAADIEILKNSIVQQIKDEGVLQIAELKNMSESINTLQSQMDDASSSLREYISELKNSIEQSFSDNSVQEKLLDLEAALVQNAENYEQKMELLQAKILEFAKLTEDGRFESDKKISSSIEEVFAIKEELIELNTMIKSHKTSSDESLEQAVSVIDSEIENVIFSINELKDSLTSNVADSLKDGMASVLDNFSNLIDIIDNLKKENSSTNLNLVESLDEKISTLKEELSLINTDIANAYQSKSNEILVFLETIKSSIEDVKSLNFEKNIDDLKSQLEISFINYTVDVNSEFAQNTENVKRLQEASKEICGKISLIEEYITEKIQNNIELLNVSVLSNLKEIKDFVDEKFEAGSAELKQLISSLEANENRKNSLDDLKNELLSKVDEVLAYQNDISKQNNLISADISGFTDGFGEEIQQACKSVLDGSKVADMIDALHAKVDILALNDYSSNLFDEIEDIRDLIFEQRKFIEEDSSERAAAIDKYLRDVLFKLDNVDLERNAEDIKESIMNVLVSLVNQISFVEETEEIKDFVEEKTDEISKNLAEMQNQLKQIASSSDDDFNYSYTLQDVESDIAKLRLAISHMSMSDVEGLSDDIKKIVSSVEGLESSLTKDEILGLKADIEKLNEDILSISSRTNKLLLTSDESYKTLNDGLNNFSSLIYQLQDRINELNNSKLSERIENKIDNIHSMSVETVNSNKIFHQVMTYLGEWIDSSSENMSALLENTCRISEISQIRESLNELREIVPQRAEIIDSIEKKFEAQELRIDRLEMKLDKLISTLEEKDDTVLNRKADKIEKMLSKLGANIEKLTSYVDEE